MKDNPVHPPTGAAPPPAPVRNGLVAETSSDPPSRPRAAGWLWAALIRTGLFVAAGLFLIAAAGVAQRAGWISSGGGESHAPPAGAGGEVVYVCPMMCTPTRSPVPARCPVCGMELAPVKSGGNSDSLAVNIEPAARRIVNIQTAPVTSKRVVRSLHTVGRIGFDERRRATISAYVAGRIEKLLADYTGVHVAQGQRMVVLYSPELYAAQVEYLVSRESAARSRNRRAEKTSTESLSSVLSRGLAENSLEKLRELGMTASQISDLEKQNKAQTRLHVCAPIGGTVIEKLRDEGDYVKVGDPIYRLADLSVVWLLLKLFPEDAARVRYGQKVEAVVQSLPGDVISGRVAFIDPVVDEKTRTVNVRVEMLNPDRRLRPGDYATATVRIPISPGRRVYDAELAGKWISPRHPQIISDGPGHCPLSDEELVSTGRYGYEPELSSRGKSLVVPRNAVLMAGSHSVVYVETKPGRFEIRRVVLGPMTQTEAIILGGVEPGEQVATAGNFLIDSQMQLSGNPSLIDPARAVPQASPPEKRLTAKKQGPLQFGNIQPAILRSEAGAALDRLYAAYFNIQKAFAADKVPPADEVNRLQTAAGRLRAAGDLPESVKTHIGPIAKNAAGLHEQKIKAGREQFKPISHAVIRLAVEVRGPQTAARFVHFYCPMVRGGGGDWLQAGGQLANPYFGSEMLRCGRKVHEFAAPTSPRTREARQIQPGPALR